MSWDGATKWECTPQKAANKLDQVRRYLAKRCIPPEYTDALIKSGKLYADNKENAVFLLLGKENKAVGAEMRGTGKNGGEGWRKGQKKAGMLLCQYEKLYERGPL